LYAHLDGLLLCAFAEIYHSRPQAFPQGKISFWAHRIVARVDQLMSLCDELEAGLMRSQADSERLIEAVVGRMLTQMAIIQYNLFIVSCPFHR